MAENRRQHKTYQNAPFEAKRGILGFFWEGFELDDGVIINSTPTLLFRELLKAEAVFAKSLNAQKPKETVIKSPFIISDTRLRRCDSNR